MSQMTSPKWAGSLEAVLYPNIQVDRCGNCKGIWFDSLEAQTFKKIEGSESLDIGGPKTGSEYNEMGDINGPKF